MLGRDLSFMIQDPGSPKANAKRTRAFLEQEDEHDDNDTDAQTRLLHGCNLPSIHSLKDRDDVMTAARLISLERIRNVLYIDCNEEELVAPPTPRMNASFFSHPSADASQMDTTKEPSKITTSIQSCTTPIVLPTRLYHLMDHLARHAFSRQTFIPPNAKIFSSVRHFGSQLNVRCQEISERMERFGCSKALGEVDVRKESIEIATLVLDCFKSREHPILRPKFHSALKGILALNNTTGTRLPGASTPVPSDSIVKLLRSVLILMDSESRQILHYTLEFIRKICECSKSSANPTATARDMSAVFGPVFTGEEPSANSIAWSQPLCELFIYAHGIALNEMSFVPTATVCMASTGAQRVIAVKRPASLLWKVPVALHEAIMERVNALRTPSRRSLMSTPTNRARMLVGSSGARGMAGEASSRRLLFPPSRMLPDSSAQGSPTKKFSFMSGANAGGRPYHSGSPVPASDAFPVFAFSSNRAGSPSVQGGSQTAALFLPSAHDVASTDRNAFAKRLKIE
ncbi:hypothetical protein HDU78_000875 [Chytriomyces hyalinus]|nr:hypothetical protein HDU78_000875 [Chytriomyces hyalinus]